MAAAISCMRVLPAGCARTHLIHHAPQASAMNEQTSANNRPCDITTPFGFWISDLERRVELLGHCDFLHLDVSRQAVAVRGVVLAHHQRREVLAAFRGDVE